MGQVAADLQPSAQVSSLGQRREGVASAREKDGLASPVQGLCRDGLAEGHGSPEFQPFAKEKHTRSLMWFLGGSRALITAPVPSGDVCGFLSVYSLSRSVGICK